MTEGVDLASRPEAMANPSQVAHHATGGIRSTGLSFALRTGSDLVVTIILARLLPPTDFGLLALAVVCTTFVQMVREFGLVNALVRQPVLTEMHLSTAFWLNLALGAFWMLVLAALAWPASLLFREPRLAPILAVLAFNILLASFGGVRRAVMNRQMRFAESAAIEVKATAFGGVVAIGLALAGAGVWSLVAQGFATTILANVLGWSKVQHRPKAIYSKEVAKDLLGFGFHATNTNLLSYLYRYLDNILIGRFLGAFSLGIYDFAYRLFAQPLNNSKQVLTRVMFPTLVALQGDEERFRAMYRRSSRYVSTLMIGAFAVLHVAAPDLILGVYGERWRPAIVVLRILTIAGLFQALLAPTGWIYQAKGRMALAFRNSVTFGLVPAVVAFAIGIHWGIEGVAWAVLTVSVFVAYPGLRIPLGLIGLSVRDAASDLAILLLAGTMAILVGYAAAAATAGWPHLAALAVEAAAVMAAYGGGLLLGDTGLVKDLWRVARGVAFGRAASRQ